MAITDLVPWRRSDKIVPIRRETNDPISVFQGRINDMFERFFDDAPFAALDVWGSGAAFRPHVDVTETDKEIKVEAELPGLDEKDVEVSLVHDMLTIRGEKKVEKEENGKNYFRMERSYGSFQRNLRLPVEVEDEKVEAVFKNGVLTITMPKTAEAQHNKKVIPVKSK